MKAKCRIKTVLLWIIFLLPTVVSAEIEVYGQINRGALFVDDGHDKNAFFVDSAYDNSLVGTKWSNRINEDVKFGSQFELWVMPNISNDVTANAVSQLNKHGKSENLKFGIADFWTSNDKSGKLSVGRGNTASKNTGTVTLSGTDLIIYAGAADMAGGMYFHPKGANRSVQSSDLQVGGDNGIFDPISGAGIVDRIRYDSPKFGPFILSTSLGEYMATDEETKNCADVALTYEDVIGKFKLKGAAGIAQHSKNNYVRAKKTYDGSFAILHMDTGLNAAVSLGKQIHHITNIVPTTSNDQHRKFYYVQVGKQSDLITYGKTNFAIDYWRANNNVSDHDKARAYGIGVVQKIDKIKTELYAGIRNYKYNTPSLEHDRIIAAILGFKINFSKVTQYPS